MTDLQSSSLSPSLPISLSISLIHCHTSRTYFEYQVRGLLWLRGKGGHLWDIFTWQRCPLCVRGCACPAEVAICPKEGAHACVCVYVRVCAHMCVCVASVSYKMPSLEKLMWYELCYFSSWFWGFILQCFLDYSLNAERAKPRFLSRKATFCLLISYINSSRIFHSIVHQSFI